MMKRMETPRISLMEVIKRMVLMLKEREMEREN